MRAQVVLLRGDHILLARHERRGWSYWVLPGGAIDGGETPEEAAVREVREETGLEIEIERLLFVDGPRELPGVSISSPRYTFLARIVGGEQSSVSDPFGGNEKHGFLAGSEWMPWDSAEYDVGTRDTLALVKGAISRSGA